MYLHVRLCPECVRAGTDTFMNLSSAMKRQTVLIAAAGYARDRRKSRGILRFFSASLSRAGDGADKHLSFNPCTAIA